MDSYDWSMVQLAARRGTVLVKADRGRQVRAQLVAWSVKGRQRGALVEFADGRRRRLPFSDIILETA